MANPVDPQTEDLELMDRIFWKLLGSSDLIEQAKKAGIHIVIEPSTEAFLIKRYGQKAEEVVLLTRQVTSTCPFCAKPTNNVMEIS